MYIYVPIGLAALARHHRGAHRLERHLLQLLPLRHERQRSV